MQPSTPQKPVMDVTAPRATPAPAPGDHPAQPPLAVREAPATIPKEQPTPAVTPSVEALPPGAESEHNNPELQQHSRPQPTAPVGTIIGAIVVMIGLSAIAIIIYLKSQA